MQLLSTKNQRNYFHESVSKVATGVGTLGGEAGIPTPSYEEFTTLIHDLHKLTKEQRSTTHITYLSPDGSTLPISNNDNLRKALETRERVLRIVVQHKGESLEEQYGYGVTPEALIRKKRKVFISAPQDFRRSQSH
ncbi:PB1 domain protein [Cooperia oncophora]